LWSEYLTNEALEVVGDFKIGVQVIFTVKYAEDLVLLNGHECGKNYGNENLKTTVLSTYYDRSKELMNVDYFHCLGSLPSSDERSMRKIKYSIATTRETFTKKKVICE
jgi:hypothetical protein